MKILRYKKTILGLTILFVLLVLSFMYPLYGPKDFNKVSLLYDDNGKVIGRPPYPPSFQHPFGIDRNGQDIFLMMISGAKYTLLMAAGVTFLRVFIGGMFGIIFSLWLRRLLHIVKDFLLVFHLIPPIILTLPLIYTSIDNEKIIYMVLLYQMIVLAIVGIPSVLSMTTEIMEKLNGESYIQSSYLMGGSHFHVLKTHLKPYLKSYGLIIALQHLVNSMGLMMFLGVFGYYIGGFSIEEVRGVGIPNSYTKEWAGLIGQNVNEFVRAPWIVLAPLFSYFFIIIIINRIKKEIEVAMDVNLLSSNYRMKRVKTRNQNKENELKKTPIIKDFTLQGNQKYREY